MLAQVQKFETRKAQLTQRVTLIEQLRRGQTTPVHVLDEVSKSLPERRVAERNEADRRRLFRDQGYAVSLPSLSDFVANLEATKWFIKPVELLDSQVQTGSEDGRPRAVLAQGDAEQPGDGRGAGRRTRGEALTPSPSRRLLEH